MIFQVKSILRQQPTVSEFLSLYLILNLNKKKIRKFSLLVFILSK